ncbi:MAG TPA: hypothetical protein VEY94_12480 [Patescibacteria group bacterium]|nr:hypothetical protein [Patescibacteria group bacterium]
MRALGFDRGPRAVAELHIAHEIGLGTLLRLAAHHGPLDAHGALLKVDVGPAQRDLLGGAKAAEERCREVVRNLRVFTRAEFGKDRFGLRQRERVGRRALHRGVLDLGSRVVSDGAVSFGKLENAAQRDQIVVERLPRDRQFADQRHELAVADHLDRALAERIEPDEIQRFLIILAGRRRLLAERL